MTAVLAPESAVLTPTCQDNVSTAALVAALEAAWAAIRARNPQVPAVVLVVGSGSPARRSARLKLGHFASLRWQHADTVLPEVLVSGEGLTRTPADVLTTLLHEAAHGLAEVRGIQDTSRQGRWHNRHFATLADELGLTASKDDKLGWSVCTMRPATLAGYAQIVADLGAVMSVYRHTDELPESGKSSNNNGITLTCTCPRKIRVAASVADEGPIVCGVCDTAFSADQ